MFHQEPDAVERKPSSGRSELTPSRLARLVAGLPPQAWARTRRRIEAIEEYLRNPKRPASLVKELAEKLGMGERNFIRIAALYASTGTIGPTVEGRRGTWSTDEEVQAIVRSAIDAAESKATDTTIYRAVVEECIKRGLPSPKISLIRSRRSRAPRKVDVRGRTDRTTDIIMDTAPLGMRVSFDTGTSLAELSAVIDAVGASVLGHAVHAQGDGDDKMAAIISRVAPLIPAGAHAIATRGVNLGSATASAMHAAGLPHTASVPTDMPAGAALRAIFGHHIGRVRIREVPPRQPIPDDEAVPIADAIAIIDLLMARRASELSQTFE